MSTGVASGWPWTSWGRPGRQVDGLSHIFVSPFDPRSCRGFLSQLLATNGATLEQNCALGCHSSIRFPVVTPLHYSFDEIFYFCQTVARILLLKGSARRAPAWQALLRTNLRGFAWRFADSSQNLFRSGKVWQSLAYPPPTLAAINIDKQSCVECNVPAHVASAWME